MAYTCVAVFGASGLEGELLLTALAEAELGVERVKAFANGADGETVMFRGRPVAVSEPSSADFSAIDVAVFLTEGFDDFAVIDAAEDAGVVVLDCTDTLAQRGDVAMFCHGELVNDTNSRLFAISDAVSSHVAAFLRLLPQGEVSKVNLAIAQPVSVLGRQGVEVLAAETARLLNGQSLEASGFGQQVAFNVLSRPVNSVVAIEHGLAAALSSPSNAVTVTANEMIVPVFYGHTAMMQVHCHKRADLSLLQQRIIENDAFRLFPQGEIKEASPVSLQDHETIDISSLSVDRQDETVFRCTVVGDNLRKGVVINVIAMLKILIKINI
ncbi:Aspartate-semialdehyde dehydrogenase 2 [Zhongshania aliphaticivorans]|uniref:Aspartate-semialdehyde dehydrogenase 2 n=1 Tax=Zhongshania aliphaticivorans TaxID=1470434 RepID=A0A5S9QDR6_9GAMM|nr:Asd/ArgC dimerization domain-containing protein [Zhongshania aliphaticivorans]CAA0087883.1 Aspartate-semialdehyde dehydrogenase 2 [Zhongshania aliphaticivorans]CAA0115592.1 Aspartate-semialdehyde dehydrogenase 2 [Zhongshania aliphaticivorans]CAA0120262.1 Aspartate-semialdehyde dehydrogenase 2 [Zhongshania aliphaticivorans]